MTWISIKPENTGGGRIAAPPSARMYKDGAFIMNITCMRLLGAIERVLVQIDPDKRAIRLTPTTPNNVDGFSINGGGGASPSRISLRKVIRKWPALAGEYREIHKTAGGVELRQTTSE